MKLLIPLLIFTNLFLSSYTKSLPISPTYEAGVVGINYIATGDPELDIQLSLEQYLNIFSLPAAANLDIIVFSEFTLNTEETAVYVPEPKNRVNPCESKNYGANDLLKILSCAAKKGQTYVVINLTEKANCPDEEMIANQDERQCRPEGVSYYNTNVVFDRNGTVISRYRKFNLFQETVDHPKYPEIVTFSTDFGITFGIFTCFDINFAEPSGSLLRKHKVTDIIFPSFWFSELPHGTAIQVQQNWAYSKNVNLLAAGASFPIWGTSGSGIYAGKLGPLISAIDGESKTQLLTATVPKRTSWISSVVDKTIRKTPKELETLTLYREEMDNYTSVVIPSNVTKFRREIRNSDGSLCCNFNIELNSQNNGLGYNYRAVVYQGIRSFQGEASGNITSCYIVACTDNTIQSCATRFSDSSQVKSSTTFKSISISGIFKYGPSDFIFPNGVDTSITPLHPSEFSYEKITLIGSKFLKISLRKERSNLLSFGIFGRNF